MSHRARMRLIVLAALPSLGVPPTRLLLLLLGAVASTACVSGAVDEEKRTETLPSGITPDDATFRYEPRDDVFGLTLVVHLSTVPLCERTGVPEGHPFVQLDIVAPPGGVIGPGTYRLEQENHVRIKLRRMTAPECASAAASIASSGFIQLDEVTEDTVRGSFLGTSRDSKIDLRGSFVATHCGANPSCL